MTDASNRRGAAYCASIRRLLLPVTALLTLALVPLLLTLAQAPWLRWVATCALAWWLPGALLVAHWRLRGLDPPTAAVLAFALGLCWMMLVALLVHWLPGPIPLWLLVTAYEAGALALLLALRWRKPLALEPAPTSTCLWLASLLILAAVLRLPGVGYHEFHIDEVEVLTRARWAIEGADNVLARHTKGPGEIMVALAVYRGLGTIEETTARLPFALLSVAAVLATALVGRRLFSAAVGFWAGVLLTFNGFALGLSRIVQYQPAVLLLSALAVLAAWEFAQRAGSSRGGGGRWLALAVLFSAFGIVLHYEFVLTGPVLLVLTWAGWRRSANKRSPAAILLVTGAAAALLVVATYVPILLDPHFAGTQKLLGTRLGKLGAFNLPFFVEMGTFYNSTYFFVGLIVLVLAGLILGLRAAKQRTLLLLLWFTPAFLLHLFIMDLPGTHFYLFMGCWSLLAALPLAAMTHSRDKGAVRRAPITASRAVLALIVLWLAVSGGYLCLLFFRQTPEYLINYDRERVPFYWAPYGKNVPKDPRFGFPIQEGWKTLGTLAGWGCLEGSFASNEGSRIHRTWYLTELDYVRLDEAPDWVFVAKHVQSPSPAYREALLAGYQQVSEVRVRDEPRIEIWAREPGPVTFVSYRSEEYARAFDDSLPAIEDRSHPLEVVRQVPLGEALTLESASLIGIGASGLSHTHPVLKPGDTLHLLLVWRPHQALEHDYKLFVHVADETSRPLAQWDGFPCSNLGRTSRWTPGETVQDHVLIPLDKDIPPGAYSLLAGFYDETTGERLGGQAIRLGTIQVR